MNPDMISAYNYLLTRSIMPLQIRVKELQNDVAWPGNSCYTWAVLMDYYAKEAN